MDTAAPSKPLRADARRNREKIVEAARAAFAESGPEAQMDEIARRAGVGVGTLYRNFPTKDALVRAIVEARMARNAAEARRLHDEIDDPWEAFATFVRTAGLVDHSLSHVLATQPRDTFLGAARDSGLLEMAEVMLKAGQAAGAIRADARVSDIPMVMCGLGAVLRHWDEDGGRRYVELVLDGLRARGCDRLPD